MPQKAYDFGVVIGRFQPFHNGHKHLVDFALEQADRVILIIGSHGQASSYRNPWSSADRERHIRSVYGLDKNIVAGSVQDRLFIGKARDFPYNNNRWISEIQNEVSKVTSRNWSADPVSICIVGHSKSDTEFYLKMFPRWDFVECPPLPGNELLNATTVRKWLFNGQPSDRFLVDRSIPNIEALNLGEDMCVRMKGIHQDTAKYSEQWGRGPFVTTDTVVTQGGHLLVIRRAGKWDSHLYALPGGFLNLDETIEDGAFRELREETKIDVPERVLRGAVKGRRTFDHPHRDHRARIITTAYFIDLGSTRDLDLPRVKGSDDAAEALWVPISELREDGFWGDHYHIANHFLNFA